jgi:hypothetical protein
MCHTDLFSCSSSEHLCLSPMLILSSPAPYHGCMSSPQTTIFLVMMSFCCTPYAPIVGMSDRGQGSTIILHFHKIEIPPVLRSHLRNFSIMIKDPIPTKIQIFMKIESWPNLPKICQVPHYIPEVCRTLPTTSA